VKISLNVVIALAFSVMAAFYLMGLPALLIILTSVLACVITEAGIQRFRNRDITISDGNAVVTGIVLALLLPQTVPLWIPMAGAVFAIAIVKQAFGGQGQNIFNPAVGGWIFLTMSWSMHMVSFPPSSTPIFLNPNAIKLGDASSAALILGGLYLITNRKADLLAPLGFVSTALLVSIFYGQNYYMSGLFALFAFFIITDPVTTPTTKKGRLLFGLGCGVLVALYSFYGNYEEGLGLSVLLMNSISPWIDKLTRPVEVAANA